MWCRSENMVKYRLITGNYTVYSINVLWYVTVIIDM